MTNEGKTLPNERTQMRTVLVDQLHRLGQATADEWERAVFQSITGHAREDVDWDVEDNHAGYYTWLKSFDQLAHELVEDGFASETEIDGRPMFRSVEGDPALWAQPADPRQG